MSQDQSKVNEPGAAKHQWVKTSQKDWVKTSQTLMSQDQSNINEPTPVKCEWANTSPMWINQDQSK